MLILGGDFDVVTLTVPKAIQKRITIGSCLLDLMVVVTTVEMVVTISLVVGTLIVEVKGSICVVMTVESSVTNVGIL